MQYDGRVSAGPLHALPAYVALERRALGRRVLIVGEADPEGCRRLLAAGARRIFVVGGGVEAGPGIEIHPPAPSLPLRDRSVDLVLLRSSIAEVVAGEVGPRIAEAARVLRAGGLLAVASDDGGEEGRRLLEGALRSSFAALRWLSLAPWRGLTIAPLGARRGGRYSPTSSARGRRRAARSLF